MAHEFLGDDIRGKNVIIIDDMISSGESMLDVARQIKERGAGRVFVCTTFGLFTDGFDKFDDYYEVRLYRPGHHYEPDLSSSGSTVPAVFCRS